MGRLSLERSPYYRLLLEDPNFKRWVSSVEEGSPNTAGCYFRRVGRICADLGKKPAYLATMNKQEAKVFIQDVIGHLRTEGNIGSTIAGYVKALKSWFIWNEIFARYAPFMEEFGYDEGNSTIYIKDNRTNRVAGVTIQGKDLMCDVDKRNDCVHVRFTYALPQAYRVMEKLGIRPPKVKA